jgi:CRISPR system Cascade subunit CasB
MTHKPYLTFSGENSRQSILYEWWNGLSKGNKAELKRCSSLEEIALLYAYHDLKLRLLPTTSVEPVHLAVLAGLASHVKENDPSLRIAQQMAMNKPGSDKPLISELRFRRLLEIEDLSELHRTMIRIIRMLGGEVNLASLAESVYWWNIKTKKQFASDYFEKISTYSK